MFIYGPNGNSTPFQKLLVALQITDTETKPVAIEYVGYATDTDWRSLIETSCSFSGVGWSRTRKQLFHMLRVLTLFLFDKLLGYVCIPLTKQLVYR